MHTQRILARPVRVRHGMVALLLLALPLARAFDATTAGSALSFGGTAYASLGSNSNLKPTATLTLELWAYSSNWTTAGRLLSCRQTGGYALSTAGTGAKLGGEVYAHGAAQVVGVTNSTVAAGWHHFALTYDGRYLRFYLDGTQGDSKDLGATYAMTYNAANSVLLAADPTAGDTPEGEYFAGKLDEVRIWNVARTQTQIQQAMLSPLVGTETGLVAYYACNEASGTTLGKLGLAAVPAGQLRNSPTWGTSGVPRAELWVDDDYTASGTNDGHTWGLDAFNAIGTAVNAAFPITIATTAGAPNQTIRVKAGTYSGASNRDMDFAGKLLLVRAEDGAAQTVIDCGSAGRAFYVHTGETAVTGIQGFTITHGSGSPGGAVFCEGSAAPVIADCIFTANGAARGGAIGVGATAAPTVRDCTFTRNSTSEQGGALYVVDGALATVENCVFTENTTRWYGGAVVCMNSSSTFTDCLFAANRTSDAADQGGAIFFWTGSPTVRRCQFVANRAVARGGAVFCQAMAPSFSDCLFLANQAGGSGGGLLLTGSPAQITDCTLAQNSAPQGGGIHCENSSPVIRNALLAGNTGITLTEGDATSDPVLTNCLFNGNTGGDYRNENTTTLTGAAAINGLAGNSANLDGDPRLAPGLTGTWTAAPAYSATTGHTTLTHATATFTAGALVGRVLNADTSQNTRSVVLANTTTTVEVSGDITGFVAVGETYQFLDYHLTYGSAAIDTGSNSGATATDLDGEARPWPAGGTVDIGADEFLDTDGDQLADTREADLGTAANDPDSDDDTLADGAEITAGTNPLLRDTDGDGDTDGTEVTRGTNPRNPASFTPWYVDGRHTSGTQDGIAWATAFPSVQAGIDAAAALGGGNVWVAAGTYLPAADFSGNAPPVPDWTCTFALKAGVRLYGGFAGTETGLAQRNVAAHPTVLSGDVGTPGDDSDNASTVVTISSVADTRLDGFTVTAGGGAMAAGMGSAIFCNNATATTLANCTISRNRSLRGGGLNGWGGSVTVTACVFDHNVAAPISGAGSGEGGAICWDMLTAGVIEGCTFTANRAHVAPGELAMVSGGSSSGGGAISVSSSGPSAAAIRDCVFTDNFTDRDGGAVSLRGRGTIERCQFAGNVALRGGALYAWEIVSPWGQTTLDDCIFRGNRAAERGGGAVVDGGQMVRCQFLDNSAPVGGGVAVPTDARLGLALTNCLLARNSSTLRGGALALEWGSGMVPVPAVLVNCTLVGNRTLGLGGAIAVLVGAGTAADSTALLANCLLWGNTASGGANQIQAQARLGWTAMSGDAPGLRLGYSLLEGGVAGIANDGNITVVDGGHNLSADPRLALPGDGHLLTGSPCIDAAIGDPASLLSGVSFVPLPALDLDDETRTYGGGLDIGADEIHGPYAAPFPIVSPDRIAFAATRDQPVPGDQTIHVRILDPQTPVSWTATSPAAWLTVNPASGTSSAQPSQSVLHAALAGLAPGNYETTLTITANGGRTATVLVTLCVGRTRWVYPGYAAGGANGGHTWGIDAFATIQAAVDAAADGDTVLLRAATYRGTGNRDIDFGGKGICVSADPAVPGAVIDCEGLGRGFIFALDEGPEAQLRGLTVIRGYSGTKGGAVFCGRAAAPTITDCTFDQNGAIAGSAWGDSGAGGALLCASGSAPTITGCRFTANQAYTCGGAIACGAGAFPVITDCVFADNRVQRYGGAVSFGEDGADLPGGMSNGRMVLSGCLFTGNFAGWSGGAVDGAAGWYAEAPCQIAITDCEFLSNRAGQFAGAVAVGTPRADVSYCRFNGNSAWDGGAVGLSAQWSAVWGGPVLRNCVFTRNTSPVGGAAIASSSYGISQSVTLVNCTLLSNASQGTAGAIRLVADLAQGGAGTPALAARLSNCVLWGNTAADGGRQISMETWGGTGSGGAATLTVGHCVLEGGLAGIRVGAGAQISSSGRNSSADPLLAFADDEHLLPGSPCIDAGTDDPAVLGAASPTHDLDGEARPWMPPPPKVAVVDIGADECTGFDAGAHLVVSPYRLTFVATGNGLDPDPQTLRLRNLAGRRTLRWAVAIPTGVTWLVATPGSGVISGAEVQDTAVSVRVAGLAPGDHECVLTVSATDDSGGSAGQIEVPVTLRVTCTRWVDPGYSQTGPNDDRTWGVTAFATIQAAIDAASEGETVMLRDGIYAGDGNRDVNFRGKAVTVRSENGPDYTVVDAEGAGYGFIMESGEAYAVLQGVTVRNAVWDGLHCNGGSPTVRDCVFESPLTVRGPFGRNSSRLLVDRCRFQGTESAAISAENCSSVIRDCVFADNEDAALRLSQRSGHTNHDEAVIVGCVFAGNGTTPYEWVRSGAGAINISSFESDLSGIRAIVKNCTFSNNRNTAMYAGAKVTLGVENCTFYGNAPPEYVPRAGAIDTDQAECTFTNCLFVGNTSVAAYADIYCTGTVTPVISSCGFSRVAGGSGIARVWVGGLQVTPAPADWVLTENPGLVDAANGDFRLRPDSPFVDAGCEIEDLFSDQRGSLRPVDGDRDGTAEFDIGAFEYARYFGGAAQDDVAKAFKDLRVRGNRVLIGYEYQVAWDLRSPLPDSDPRIVEPGEYRARLLLEDDQGQQIELLTTLQELDWAELGYTLPLTFGYEHLGTWYLRLELLDDPRQFVLSDEPIAIEYDTPVEYAVGDQILPPDGALAGQQPDVDDESFCFWSEGSHKLYAVAPGATMVTWYADAAREIPIPVLVGLDWHDEDESDPLYRPAQGHVAGAPVVALLPAGSRYDSVSLKYSSTNETLSGTEFETPAPPAGSAYHSVLYYHHTRTGAEAIEVVRTVIWQTGVSERPAERDGQDAIIGTAIVAPPVHQPACGGGYVITATARLDGSGDDRAYDRTTRTGPIIPVNEDDPGADTGDLAVVWYATGLSGAAWPFLPMRYRARWPSVAEGLQTLAIETWYADGATPLDGSGPLAPATYGPANRMSVYHQPDRTTLGYNPNEEHALLAASPASTTGVRALYALRNDLNRPGPSATTYETGDTSRPYVLLKHQSPTGGGWAFTVFRVVVTPTVPPASPQYAPFRRLGVSGEPLSVPYPIRGLSGGLCPDSAPAAGSGPAYQDKNGVWYALQPVAGQPVVMDFWYPLQAAMWYDRDGDGTADAAVGACIAWRVVHGSESTGRPVDVTYDIAWPADPPQLQVGETLLTAKDGDLPEITGQCSVKLLYNNAPGASLVRLVDPLAARSVALAPLTALPAGIRTRTQGTRVLCIDLPVHLQVRASYDPTARALSFAGYLDDTVAGEPLLLPNVMSAADQAALTALAAGNAAWVAKAAALAEATRAPWRAEPGPDDPGLGPGSSDAKALSAGAATGTGKIIMAFNEDAACAGPVKLQVIGVNCPLYVGEIKVMEPENIFDERVVLRHTGDCGGESDARLFQWEWCYDADGNPAAAGDPGAWFPWSGGNNQVAGAVEITVEGTGDRTLADKWFRCKYRHDGPCGSGAAGWSAWTPPQLYQGWIKRVLAAINLFDQRFKDFHASEVSTVVAMIRQAGERYEGDVALNYDPDTLNDVGLIEFYTTVLRRGRELTIDAVEPLSTEATNQQLMLIASRLADLYMLLGNEAYADAADPTIGFGTDDGQYGATATSIFCFQNQVPSLLEEELALLRGVAADGRSPFYNHLVWNFTQTEGEVAYVGNYQITDQNQDGAVNEADARLMVPQGHGDAWGHYLTATTIYYDLLKDSHFTWIPRAEAVLVAGAPVTVDYVDERRFAAAAAAKARTGAEIVDLTYRGRYTEDPEGQWQGYKDTDTTRAWGLSEWGQRAGQAAFFDWVASQAVLPVEDTAHTGVQRIDRSTVPELRELAAAYRDIQVRLDDADVGLSPLGLAGNAVPFDIDPQQIDAGRTHFEQIHDRAVQALANAVTVFDHANRNTQLLRRQADSIHTFQTTVIEREADFRNRLIEIFGSPYTDDIGPGRTYATGYDGPDLYHYMVVDPSELTGVHEDDAATQDITVTLKEPTVAADGSLSTSETPVTYRLSTTGLGIVKPASWSGQRLAPGELQMAHSDLLQTHGRFARALQDYDNLLASIEDQAGLLQAQYGLNSQEIDVLSLDLDTQESLNSLILKARLLQLTFRRGSSLAVILADAAAEFLPTCVGFSTDVAAPARGAIKLGGGIIAQTLEAFANFAELAELDVLHAKETAQARTNIALTTARGEFAALQQLKQLEQMVRQETSTRYDIYVLQEALQQSQQRYVAALARGQRLLEDRLRFRCQTAASTQEMRYKDMTFRVFRNDALQKYWAQFDLAARYAYLAARAYDYETNLLDGDGRGAGSEFLTQIVRTRSIGLYQDGRPLPAGYQGDPGLADAMARMKLNWDLVLKGQLGFSNPQTETNRFSLRRELYHLSAASQDDTQWRQNLASCISTDLLSEPAFQRYCRAFYPQQSVEPGLIIPFATHIEFGTNFFGLPLWGGDNAYDSSNFATKIRSVGIWFSNYSTLAQNGLSNTPRVYLVPIGDDRMRSPTGYSGETRDWTILDQLIPVPFPISGSDLANPRWIPLFDSLTGDFAGIRRYASFRAYHDSGSFNESEVARDSRLIGRSVWNTHWLLIIPAGTLHSDRTEALRRFIYGRLQAGGSVLDDAGQRRDGNGVSDIRLFFQTYAYSGAKK